MSAEPNRDRWLIGLAARLAAGESPPAFAGEQVDRILAYLDAHQSFDAEAESRIRAALTPAWLRAGPSLREARRDLRTSLDEGIRCPCCDKFAKRYKRRLNGAVVRSLAWLVLASDDPRIAEAGGWVDVPKHGPRWMMRGNPHPKLALWGFAERRPIDDESSSRSSGVWRPTSLGRAFVDGSIDAPAHLYEYLSEVQAFAEQRVRFSEVLDVAFDYRALMDEP